MYALRRFSIAILFIVITWFAVVGLKQHLDPNTHISDEEREDARWIATSKHWLDRNACRWIGLCGLAHYHWDPAAKPKSKHNKKDQHILNDIHDDFAYAGWGKPLDADGKLKPGDFEDDDRVLKEVPQFVLDHAPLIHLYSGEEFWPSDIAEHLMNTLPYRNHTSLQMNISQHTVHNLHELNERGRGRFLFMQSKDDVEDRPRWLGSSYNRPVPFEDEEPEEEVEDYTEWVDMDTTTEDNVKWYDPFPKPETPKKKTSEPLSSARIPNRPGLKHRRRNVTPIDKPLPSGRSPAPAILILVDKGHGILDAFWFYFYSYNLGTTVMTMRFGNHIGDWEHSLIRFHHGVPKAVFFSAHSGGTAFSYNSVEKGEGPGREGRPILYSALGSHAMYAMPGKHPYVLPFGLLADRTDKGPLWDPALNYYAYHFNTSITHNVDAKTFAAPNGLTSQSLEDSIAEQKKRMLDKFEPAANNPSAPTSWFWYTGHWGDKFYELGDWRQWRFVGQYHYVNGPLGPRFKNLGRSKVCQSGWSCRILDSITDKKGKSWISRRMVPTVLDVPEA